MKMNKWTMALAAAGVVSLSSVAQAQEAVSGANALAASTTLSGYVSSSFTNDDLTTAVDDKFNLDVVDLKLASAQGAGEYATGYTVELWAGDDNPGTGNQTDTVELYQANVDLRLPVGNGLDLKVGQFTTVVGADSLNRNENTFWNRSIGFDTEPTHHTGILGSYQMSDDLSVKLGFVNDTTSNNTNTEEGSGAAYLVRLDYTLPESAGFLGGVGVSYGRVDGAGAAAAEQDNQYIGISVPLGSIAEGLSYNLAWDIAEYSNAGWADSNVVGHTVSYAANEKMTLNARYETGNTNGSATGVTEYDGLSTWTLGVDYKLWENVISRVEYRSLDSDQHTTGSADSVTFNIIYSF